MPDMTPVQAQWVTLGFILATTVVVIGYDVLAIRAWGMEASISRVLRRMFDACPTFCAAFLVWLGIMIGHYGFPVK